MKTYICTSGTSVATNRDVNLERFADKPVSSWDDHREHIKAVKQEILNKLREIDLSKGLDATSAEIKSLVKIGLDKNDHVVLITSDTLDGKLCAEIIKDYLTENLCQAVEIKLIKGLQASNGELFRKEGLKNLFDYLVTLLEEKKYQDIVLNPTGGYKSVVPYIALTGMLFNKPVQYIHENSHDVLTLTGVPVTLDDNLILKIEKKLQRIENETFIPLKEWQEDIDYHDSRFDCLVDIEGGQVTMSGMGLLFWERFKKDFPPEIERDTRPAFKKDNKLRQSGKRHHGYEQIMKLADKLLGSVYVKSILGSCNNQPKAKGWIKPLTPEEAQNHLQIKKHNVCMVTDIQSDAGYSFLVETTAKNTDENKKIAELLIQDR